jgi:enediyne biosynthesis protein E4
MADKAGVASTKTSRGGAIADFNLDGRLDLLVVNRWETAQVWRNVTEKPRQALMLRLSQEGPNVNAIGAFIEVKTTDRVQRREITSGGGHVSGQSGWIHFGIGDAEEAEVRVRWPGSGWSEPQPLKAGSFAILERGAAAPQPWQPTR